MIIEQVISLLKYQTVRQKRRQNNESKSKYEKAVNALFYGMLNDSKIIEKCKKEHVCFLNANDRHLSNEIVFNYEKYGSVNIADMYTYLADNSELLALLNKIVSTSEYNYSDMAINDYIKVISDYNKKQEIKRLNKLLVEESDLVEKSKIAEEIRLIKVGENRNGQ